ncbi:hypothetical protein BJX68DRAFT_265146 [Aspergillus pseudodeflectus]|uniref:Major facilitator superfamily domain-containing protein n=1 Tax=Aspergillus pseudodeflectus TaxID=176178 RepID=A0ABR4KN36_9EURO
MQVPSAGKLRYGERTTGYNIVSWLDWLMLRHGYQEVLCFGLANFVYIIPAYFFIDGYHRRGRRIPLLVSLGGMFITLACISGLFFIDDTDARLGLVSAFTIVIFLLFYGIGAGLVPFTFKVGMSFSVMVNFLGLGLLVLFVPAITHAFGDDDNTIVLFIFTALDAMAFILVFLFVPSTGGFSLEEMDKICMNLYLSISFYLKLVS